MYYKHEKQGKNNIFVVLYQRVNGIFLQRKL